MIDITSFPYGVEKYNTLGKNNIIQFKIGCQCCGYKGRLHRHGYYFRNAITQNSIYRIPILRFKCPICNKIYSALPSFLIPYFQYIFDFIFSCLYDSYISKLSYKQIIDKLKELNFKGSFNAAHITHFKKRMNEIKDKVYSFFCADNDVCTTISIYEIPLIIKNIKDCIEKNADFSLAFYERMHGYFFSSIKVYSL